MGPHRIRVEVPHGESVFTRVYLDGEEVRGVIRARFDTGDPATPMRDRTVMFTLDLWADVEIVGDDIPVSSLLRTALVR